MFLDPDRVAPLIQSHRANRMNRWHECDPVYWIAIAETAWDDDICHHVIIPLAFAKPGNVAHGYAVETDGGHHVQVSWVMDNEDESDTPTTLSERLKVDGEEVVTERAIIRVFSSKVAADAWLVEKRATRRRSAPPPPAPRPSIIRRAPWSCPTGS